MPGSARSFPCRSCGADLAFKPGLHALACDYCGTENALPGVADNTVREQDYLQTLAVLKTQYETIHPPTLKCNACGAAVDRPPHIDALPCPFCGFGLVDAGINDRVLRPEAVLPFHLNEQDARDAFRRWVRKLWFAPNALKRDARNGDRLTGVYIPYWTYDTHTVSEYTGQRGEHYWETEHYWTTETRRDVHGRTVSERVRKSRRVRKTRWYPASGTVAVGFDDLLVLAGKSLPEALVKKLTPWDLAHLQPYQDAYLAGMLAERYQVGVEPGFAIAQQKMAPTIRSHVRSDIGGDEQRIHRVTTDYHDIAFKHILLPIWSCAYRFNGQVYRYLVNARTGKVQGHRPYSYWKITATILTILAVIATAATLLALNT
ncbi:MAG: hypothetical protein ACIAXF_02430 [Phycisphaerales bacterium JB063]